MLMVAVERDNGVVNAQNIMCRFQVHRISLYFHQPYMHYLQVQLEFYYRIQRQSDRICLHERQKIVELLLQI